MVSREDVVAAYRLILGRDPENDTTVLSHMRSRDLGALRRTFMASPEFRSAARNLPSTFSPFTGGLTSVAGSIDWSAPIRVDLTADKKTMRRLLQRVERCWTEQGQTEPFWSVLSHEKYKQQNFAPNAEGFYASGEHDAMRLAAWLDRNEVDWSKFESCLELGCGTGRVTPWLARRFLRVLACDISPPHLQLAADEVRRQGLQNVKFVHTLGFGFLILSLRLMSFSVLLSSNTTRHPSYMRSLPASFAGSSRAVLLYSRSPPTHRIINSISRPISTVRRTAILRCT